jgi:hypothetical protein
VFHSKECTEFVKIEIGFLFIYSAYSCENSSSDDVSSTNKWRRRVIDVAMLHKDVLPAVEA